MAGDPGKVAFGRGRQLIRPQKSPRNAGLFIGIQAIRTFNSSLRGGEADEAIQMNFKPLWIASPRKAGLAMTMEGESIRRLLPAIPQAT
jgi:hypothetical protein